MYNEQTNFYNYPLRDYQEIHNLLGNDDANQFEGKTILLPGGSGALGTAYKLFFLYLNQFVLSKPCFVISVDNYIGRQKPKEIEDKNLLHLEHDLTTPLDLELWEYKFDYIINCSMSASPSVYRTQNLNTLEVGTTAVKLLLKLALQHKAKILNFSSSEIFGAVSEEELPVNEETVPRILLESERTIYDHTKVHIRVLSDLFRKDYGLDCKCVSPFNVASLFRQNDYRVLPNFISKILKNEKIDVYLPGSQYRVFIHYSEFITITLKILLDSKQGYYHVANPANKISMVDLANLVAKTGGKSDLVNLIPAPSVYNKEPKHRQTSIDRIVNEFGFIPTITIGEIIERLYSWAKETYQY